MTQGDECTPATPGSGSAGAMRGQVAEAVADLAQRLGVSPAEIEIIGQEEVTWPDTALGCPEPGMVYAQVLVPGSRIVLQSGGHRYEYHSGDQRRPFLCESPGN